MTINIIMTKTGNCFVIEPSYASPQNVVPISHGNTGIKNLVTMLKTICWNSSRRAITVLLLFHAAASPTVIDRNNAEITGIIGLMLSLNTTSGRDFSPSTSEAIFMNGRIV